MIIENKMSEVIKNMKVTSDKSTKDRLLESYFTLGNEIRYVRIKADDSKEDQYELIKNKVTDILDSEGLLEKQVGEFIQYYDRFVLKNLDEIKHPYVGWKIINRETANFFIDKKSFSNYLKVEIPIEYIGFDHDYQVQYYINQGYNVLDKKNLEEVRGIVR
ncbi:hypothetical protein [Clostridium beijerinckii]|uniref:hypothetical protein n=1 Tax=Clostridium beijerinckii TaxID=1520 RepID=UPI001494C671|nr:hypothetical protein [Clostridium beijerinckii]NOW07225.1 hypothetical protein [Clostridium beijerinckii]NYC05001.1 hypothetical protein [Clostridium beijerinckii]